MFSASSAIAGIETMIAGIVPRLSLRSTVLMTSSVSSSITIILSGLDDLLGVLVHYDYLERVVRPLELQHVAVSGEVFDGVLLVAVDDEREVLNLPVFPAVYRDRLVVHVDVVLLAYVVKAEAEQDEQDDERDAYDEPSFVDVFHRYSPLRLLRAARRSRWRFHA